MREALWTFAALVSYWRRHPGNLATLIVGLALATSLWSGVQALNQQARKSYDQAAAVFDGGGVTSIVPVRGGTFAQELYVKLRRAGWKVAPIIEGSVRTGSRSYRVIGIDPLTLPRESTLARVDGSEALNAFILPPWRMLAARETADELIAGGAVTTDRGHPLPPIEVVENANPGILVVDVGAAQTLLEKPGRLSRLLFASGHVADGTALAAVAGDELRFVAPSEEGDLERLTASFHLNLTAFGLLSFFVGLFIVHAALSFAFEQRLSIIRTVRAVGVSLRTVMIVLIAELMALALFAGVLGTVCGYLIAAALLPDVAASLDGLYGAQVPGTLALEAEWCVAGLAMTLLGALAAAGVSLLKTYRMPVLAMAQPFAWREAQQRYLVRQGWLAALAFVVAVAAFVFGRGLVAGFIVIAGVLVGAALILPVLLASALKRGEGAAEGPLAQWFWADARQQLSGLSLALMALFVALAANIGVGTMVEGFRQTFTAWLDERLVAEVYLDAASNAEAQRVAAWLKDRKDVTAVLPYWRGETRIGGWPVEVYGFRDHSTYRDHFPLIVAQGDAWQRVANGQAILVSEQLARRLGVSLGERLEIPTSQGVFSADVAGIYPDYGNPKGQLRLALDVLAREWPEVRQTGFSLRMSAEAVPGLIAAMKAALGPAIAQIIDQASLKALSTSIFERTFAVTAALNTLTLIVSGIALLASLLTLSNLRLAQLAPVWAVGVTRWRLAKLELLKIVVLAAATAVLAVPLGLMLAWCLVAIVNVEAFGWRLPFHVFPLQWLQVLVLAVVTALIASIVPIVRLARTQPAALIRVFANER